MRCPGGGGGRVHHLLHRLPGGGNGKAGPSPTGPCGRWRRCPDAPTPGWAGRDGKPPNGWRRRPPGCWARARRMFCCPPPAPSERCCPTTWCGPVWNGPFPRLSGDPAGGDAAAAAILTTDARAKQIRRRGGGYQLGGMAKGAGMVRPDMATMLGLSDHRRPSPRRAAPGGLGGGGGSFFQQPQHRRLSIHQRHGCGFGLRAFRRKTPPGRIRRPAGRRLPRPGPADGRRRGRGHPGGDAQSSRGGR